MKIAWREAGDGPPVLFLHGLGGTRFAWEPQLEGLSDRYRCIAWDMPGYGDSDPLPELTFPAIADAIAMLLDQLDIERTHIVGLSFGGQQAIHFALRHADRLDRLVLADTSHRFGDDGTDPEEWKRLRLDALDAGLTPADIAESVIDSIVAPHIHRTRTRSRPRRLPPDFQRRAARIDRMSADSRRNRTTV